MKKQGSNVSNLAPRSEIVSLTEWKTVDGEPVQVECHEIDQESLTRITGVLPGARPTLGLVDSAAEPGANEKNATRLVDLSAALIELGTCLRAPDGTEVRPAFWFDASKPRHALSIPGSKLHENDLVLMAAHILRCSGSLGGAAEASFRCAERGGSRNGNGTLAVLQGGRADAEAGVP